MRQIADSALKERRAHALHIASRSAILVRAPSPRAADYESAVCCTRPFLLVPSGAFQAGQHGVNTLC
jgi:hypothetical protein